MSLNKEQNNFTKYIITIYQYKQSNSDLSFKWEKLDDGYAYLTEEDYGKNLKISLYEEDKNFNKEYLMNEYITNDMRFEFKNLENPKRFNIFIETPTNKIGLQFDNNSNSAFNNFKDELEKGKSMKKIIKYYNSENIKYIGSGLNNKKEGNGTEFYDDEIRKYKYIGEFENNKYDGSGKFYSYDQKIEVHINNISRGKANGNCTLILKSINGEDIEKKNFNISRINLDLLDLESETFCEDIAEVLIPNLKNLVFNKMKIEEKLLEIYNKIENLNERLDDLYYKQEEEIGILRRLFKLIW
jgi:hypothetical protein